MPSSQFSSPMHSHHSNRSSQSPYRSPQMRKEILRNVYENTQALQNNVNTKTVENLEQMIEEVDSINEEGSLDEKVKNQGEVLLDSAIMALSSHVLQKCTSSLNSNISSYDSHEFASKIKSFLCKMPDTISVVNDEPNWSLLGNEVMQYFKKTAKFSIILGTLRPIPKKEIVRRKIIREAQAPTKRPENVITLDQVEDSIEKTVVEITKIVGHYQKQNKKPLDFFALVLHPTDFGKTIENILHVSFLIKDGHFKFTLDEDGVPQVEKTGKNELSETKVNKKKRNIQNVLSLTMKQWRVLVKAYNIQKSMIDINTKNAKNK